MDDFLSGEFRFAESMLVAAKENLQKAMYEDAETCARMAMDRFFMFRDDAGFFQKAFQGIWETSGIALEARRLWIESGCTPSPEDIDKLREEARQRVDELDRGFCAAVRSVANGSPLVR